MQNIDTEKTYGCEDCKYYKNHRCKLWQVVISKPDDSHCESLQRTQNPPACDYGPGQYESF